MPAKTFDIKDLATKIWTYVDVNPHLTHVTVPDLQSHFGWEIGAHYFEQALHQLNRQGRISQAGPPAKVGRCCGKCRAARYAIRRPN